MLGTLQSFVQRVWAERDEAAIDELVVTDARAHGLGEQVLIGPDGFKSFQRSICAQLHDTRLVIDHHIEAEGWLAALCTFTGTTAGGRTASVNGAIHARIVDGRIVEAYNHFDFIGLFIQMGLLPPDTVQRCMSGQPVGMDDRLICRKLGEAES
jgi:hypothetical protein